MSSKESSVLNFSDSTESRQESRLDVGDVPDRILEALHYIRQLRAEAEAGAISPERAAFIGRQTEALLTPVPAVLAAAAIQLAEVA